MKIYAKSPSTKLSLGQMVNKFGQYLYTNIDSAYKLEKHPNMCDVYFTLYYQIPLPNRHIGNKSEAKMNEMNIDLNITTYADKLRVNVIEVSELEKTLGCYVVSKENLTDLHQAENLLIGKIEKRLNKLYKEYDFIF